MFQNIRLKGIYITALKVREVIKQLERDRQE